MGWFGISAYLGGPILRSVGCMVVVEPSHELEGFRGFSGWQQRRTCSMCRAMARCVVLVVEVRLKAIGASAAAGAKTTLRIRSSTAFLFHMSNTNCCYAATPITASSPVRQFHGSARHRNAPHLIVTNSMVTVVSRSCDYLTYSRRAS